MAEDCKHIDVVICGGGIVGICTSYFLAKKGVFSIVVEKDKVANAASGKAGGFLARDWNTGSPINDIAEASFDLHEQLAKELDGEKEYGYRRIDTHSVTLEESGSYDKACHNMVPTWLDGDVVQRPYWKVGTKATNAQIHPHEFCQTLRKHCSNMGVVFLTNSEVTDVAYSSKDKPTVITINGAKEISADVVVIAMGPWTGNAKKWFPTLTSSIYGQKAHSITVTPATPLTAEAIFTACGDCSSDIYPRPDGEAYVCGLAETPKPSDKLDPPGLVFPTPGSCARLRSMSGRMASAMRDGQLNVEQACYLPLTEDGLPIIGKVPQFDGVYVAAGHSYWGILNSPITGKLMAELIVNGRASIDISAFSPERLSE